MPSFLLHKALATADLGADAHLHPDALNKILLNPDSTWSAFLSASLTVCSHIGAPSQPLVKLARTCLLKPCFFIIQRGAFAPHTAPTGPSRAEGTQQGLDGAPPDVYVRVGASGSPVLSVLWVGRGRQRVQRFTHSSGEELRFQ